MIPETGQKSTSKTKPIEAKEGPSLGAFEAAKRGGDERPATGLVPALAEHFLKAEGG